MRETGRYGVEARLKKQVALAGGATRKFVSPGRPNVPDQIVIWPRVVLVTPRVERIEAEIHFVETKAPGKSARGGQKREHKRLRKLGCQVFVLDTKERIDAYIEANR
ncbi:MAG: VRR-NUC domain-containing protein [Deltaproteobacteria bacterium]|nr:VRR-NUC domain-containing protein [Deltaproteobacteria bacterium]